MWTLWAGLVSGTLVQLVGSRMKTVLRWAQPRELEYSTSLPWLTQLFILLIISLLRLSASDVKYQVNKPRETGGPTYLGYQDLWRPVNHCKS